MRLLTRILFSLPHNGGAHGAPARERRGVSGPRKRPSRGVGRSPTLDRYAAPDENSVLVPHNGGAHGAPARERRGVSGPRKRPSRGVGRSPT